MPYPIEAVTADITTLAVDAIVTAATELLQGGGGVDAAIHRAAGPELLDECRRVGACRTGEARLTKAYRLPAKYVIHTVGPAWHGGGRGEDGQLAECYRHSLSLALRHHVRTIAFPAISTGALGFPVPRAASVAAEETTRFLQTYPEFDKIYFACHTDADRDAYAAALRAMDER